MTYYPAIPKANVKKRCHDKHTQWRFHTNLIPMIFLLSINKTPFYYISVRQPKYFQYCRHEPYKGTGHQI